METIIRSSISPKLLKSALVKGTIISGMGALLLVLGGSFIPLALLKKGGFFIFCLGIFLIFFGLFPYRQLKKIEQSPYELHGDEKKLLFLMHSHPFAIIPLHAIISMEYQMKQVTYGLCLTLQNPLEQHIQFLCPLREAKRFIKKFSLGKNTILLPFFSQKACQQLQKSIKCPTE